MPGAVLAALLVSSSASLLAQAPSRGIDCSRAKDPEACEERVAKGKAAFAKARRACEGRKGDEARECMRRELCAQTKDPARCEAQAKEGAERRAKIREACKDQKGDALRSCIRERRQKSPKQ